MRLRRAHAGDEHRGARRESAGAADDVAEFLEAEVAGEARFGDDVVGQLERDAVRQDRVVRVRDVAERAGMHQRRLALERLHQVRLDRVLHDHGHRAAGLEHVGRDELAVVGRRDDDAAEPAPEILQVAGQREHRHHLGRGGDDELVLARDPVRLAAEADDRVAQLAVVHVDRPRPHDGRGIDAQRVAVEDRRVDRRGQQAVGGRDGVEVAVEVEVDLLHRADLRVPAARAAALDAEHRAHRRLAQAQHDLLADLAEALCQRHARRRLAFTGLGRRDRGDDDELAVLALGQPFEDGQLHLAAVLAELFELVRQDAGLGGDIGDRLQLRVVSDVEC